MTDTSPRSTVPAWLEPAVDAERIAVVIDLDGTLVPFAPEPGALDDEARKILTQLAAAPGVRLVVLSGRRRADVDLAVDGVPNVWVVAEHGAFRRADGAYEPLLREEPVIGELADDLERLVTTLGAGRVERKAWSVTLHFRGVTGRVRRRLLDQSAALIDEWVARHIDHDRLEGPEAIEVRPNSIHKGTAVDWVRSLLGPSVPMIVLGDSPTDEDAFEALGERDVSIYVGSADSETAAKARLPDVDGVRAFLRDLARYRSGDRDVESTWPLLREPHRDGRAVLVISNRLPHLRPDGGRKRSVGGLVAALEPALRDRGGVWLGWSGKSRDIGQGEAPLLRIDHTGRVARASLDFPVSWERLFYQGFSNRSLWPLLHGMTSRTRYLDDEWRAYVTANEAFAEAATRVVSTDTSVWVHDYQLLLAGAMLRKHGHRGPIGFFLHVPFPAVDLFETIPWADRITQDLCAYDLIGFHTARYASNFVATARELLGAATTDDTVVFHGHSTRVGVFPIGIAPADFAPCSVEESDASEVTSLITQLDGRKLVLGVDRLDYTKGIPERLRAFSRMLKLDPSLKRRVSFLQIAVPTREEVPEYAEQRALVEAEVGRINGEHGEADWVPVRYLHRSYGRETLAQLYCAADVAVVTPLRDGMNLVAKEFVAAQRPENPGVLLLSKFAGAAVELRDGAVLTNPFHVDGMARDLSRALSIPLEERRERHQRMWKRVRETTAYTWCDDFLAALERTRELRPKSIPPMVISRETRADAL